MVSFLGLYLKEGKIIGIGRQNGGDYGLVSFMVSSNSEDFYGLLYLNVDCFEFGLLKEETKSF